MRAYLFIAFLAVAMSNGVCGLTGPEAKLTLNVVDETSQPVARANVGASFELSAEKSNDVEGQTDEKGAFVASGRTSNGHVSFGADLPGYYETSGVYQFWEEESERWQPWNPTVVMVLKRILNPIPMYARRVSLSIPEESKPVDFDLMAGDWVAPYGSGKVSDFRLRVVRQVRDFSDYSCTLELTFSNPDDGIQPFEAPYNYGSALKSPHIAPETGYFDRWKVVREQNPKQDPISSRKEDRNFMFRVRTVMKNGTIETAMYGKIYGDIEIGGYAGPRVGVGFAYYLNPDGTRNIEFDPKKNLFKNLQSFDKPTAP